MNVEIPENLLHLLEKPFVVVLVTLMEDGHPQGTPVWCSWDGSHIWVNTARGRQKDQNMRARPQVTVVAIDPQNPYQYLEVRGLVDEVTEEGALDHINTLSKAYVNRDDYYAGNPGRRDKETRVIYKIKPIHVSG